MSKTYSVVFYEVDMAYGGPEEGGWWYRTYDFKRILTVCKSEDEAYRIAGRADRLLDIIQRDHRELSSVLYDGGRYEAIVTEGLPPVHIPENRPHYE